MAVGKQVSEQLPVEPDLKKKQLVPPAAYYITEVVVVTGISE